MTERLQKILARAGYGSRRSAESLIASGRVTVNGHIVREPGTSADPDVDIVAVDGAPVRPPSSHLYLAMNKPAGILTTAHDPQRRRTVMDLLPADLPPHVIPIGRLDRDTAGLLFFTDDGEFAHRIAHPRFEMDKEYLGLVRGAPPPAALRRLREGVLLDGRDTTPARVEEAQPPCGYETRDAHVWLRIVIHEGRKRQVRRMCALVGHPVRTLVRTRIGAVNLGRLPSGQVRTLTAREVEALRQTIGLGAAPATARRPHISPGRKRSHPVP